VGRFQHPPNEDAFFWLRHEVWPRVRAACPGAVMHVYGSAARERHLAEHDPGAGFLVHGYAPSMEEALLRSRVLLAPLRYGAGIKGKIADAFAHGLPVATTPIGAEGMLRRGRQAPWGGSFEAQDATELAEAAVQLHEDRHVWQAASTAGQRLVEERFAAGAVEDAMVGALERRVEGLWRSREEDVWQSVLQREESRSTEFMARYIEAKAARQ